MNKMELVAAAAAKSGDSQRATKRALDAIVETIIECTQRGEEVKIQGLGTFSVSKRAARKGRNVITGETVHIPERNLPKFTASLDLKAAALASKSDAQ